MKKKMFGTKEHYHGRSEDKKKKNRGQSLRDQYFLVRNVYFILQAMANQCKKALWQAHNCPQRHQVLIPGTCKCQLKRDRDFADVIMDLYKKEIIQDQ